MPKIRVTDRDLADIQRVLAKFPDVKSFELKQYGQSGIGSCLDMIFETEVNNIKCKIVVPIADESTW